VVSTKKATKPGFIRITTLFAVTFLYVTLQAVPVFAVPSYSFGRNAGGQTPYIRSRAAPGDMRVDTTYYQQGDFIGKLYIERFGRVVDIFEGETLANMDKGAGRFGFSGLNYGNTALIGHNRGVRNGFFSFVRQLEIGDILRLEAGSRVREYVVIGIRIVRETDFSWAADFGDTRLTLVTCVEYQRDYRRIVYAVQKN